jgi:hypothetical protein
LCNPTFRRKLDHARAAAVIAAGTALSDATGQAVRKLRALLDCGNRSVELGAANAILNQAWKSFEVTNTELRTGELERRADARIGELQKQLTSATARLRRYEPPPMPTLEDVA